MVDKIKKVLRQEDTVLFIGSGISLWSGLPTWTGLINELIIYLKANGLDTNLVARELKNGDLLQAASYGFYKLTNPQTAEFIRDSCRISTAKPHEIHSKIISLGPNCYITTNYDKLLELSFEKWLSDIYIRKVVNKQLIETAEIVGARTNNFLFKLHGDAEDSDSIILTREQYRKLNSGGELNHALETAKTLMLTRPIIYIGFGLRDPDFLYLKDLLLNTFKGGARDHYAIMPDVEVDEIEYWRTKFGIHILSYKTTQNQDGSKNHSFLLDLLDELSSVEISSAKCEFKIDNDLLFNLVRHAGKYSSFKPAKLHLPLIVHPIVNKKALEDSLDIHRYNGADVEALLTNGPEKLILIGLPGGGKSYSIKNCVSKLANELTKECFETRVTLNKTIIPIYVDLKLYNGNIINTIENNIPYDLNFEVLCNNFKVKLFLDAFNEMPKEFIESNVWNTDLSNLLNNYSFSIVISSRTIDGLDNLNIRGFNIDSISKDFIKNSLLEREIKLEGNFKDEVINLLQKPFLFDLVFRNNFKIDSNTSPQLIYSDLINSISYKFIQKFATDIDIVNALSNIALDSIDSGEEAFKVDDFNNHLDLELSKISNCSISNTDIINWLISQNFLIPIVNERLCFFHQSVTEYLAANKFAKLYSENDKILKEKLKFRRWDQALYTALNLQDDINAEKFINTIIDIDFEMALSATKYIENDSKCIIDKLLKEIILIDFEKDYSKHGIIYLLQQKVPLNKSHTEVLKQIVDKGNSIGGVAVSCLLEIYGNSFKQEAFDLLIKNSDDYNFCSQTGRALKAYIIDDDLPQIAFLCNQVQEQYNLTGYYNFEGFDSALGDMLEDFNSKLVYTSLFDPSISLENQEIKIKVLLEFLKDCKSSESLKISSEILLLGVDEAAVVIYFITKFSKEKELDYSIFSAQHIEILIKILKLNNKENSVWSLNALRNICIHRIDLHSFILKEIDSNQYVFKAALYYIISHHNDMSMVFSTLSELKSLNEFSLSKEPLSLIKHMDDLEWHGNENLFVELIRLRNTELAYQLCDNYAIDFRKEIKLKLNIGSITWWLEWFNENINHARQNWMFFDRVPRVLCVYIPTLKKYEFINEFNRTDSPFRDVIAHYFLKNIDILKIEDLTEESIDYLINDLKRKNIDFFESSVLLKISTETFVKERLVPLMNDAKGNFHNNLKTLINEIGKKHKLRYLID
jgi:hypothetical protein